MMNVVAVDSVERMGVLGIIDIGHVNVKEDMKSVVSSDIENEGRKEGSVQLKGMSVKSVQEVTLAAAVKPATEVRIESKQADTREIKNKPEQEPDPEARLDLNADLQREGIKRLAEMERLAEKVRQEKIRRREELDRVARLQRILALVRAPKLDSVAKMKQMADLERVGMIPVEEITDLKEMGVMTEINPVLKLGKLEDKEAAEYQEVAERKAVEGVEMLATKKQITEYQGIEKLERMSKSERIAEIVRLLNLELEAEAKRKAELERIAELERQAELERVAKMNRLTKIDLSAEIKRAEKERLEETKRQEEIRKKEELERFAKLQRILAMVLATESDQVEEAQAVTLERVKEMKHRYELKYLRELGILPKEEVNETEIGKIVKPMEEETLIATLAIEPGADPVEEVKPVTELKDVNSGKVVKPITDVNQLKRVKADVEVESIAKLQKLAEAERDANIMSAAVISDRRTADRETRKRKQKEELERIANLQRIIAMVLNTEVDQVGEIENVAELEKVAERKRKEEMNVLEDLGVVSKSQVTQPNGTEVKPVVDVKQETVLKLEKDTKELEPLIEVKEVAKVDVENVSIMEHLTKQTEIKSGVVVEADREGKIKRASELENKAKADREARIKGREELVRVANLQRVVAMVHNEEFDGLTEMKKEELERIAEKKRREDMKVLEELGLVSKYQLTQEMDTSSAVGEKDNVIEITPVEDANIEGGFKAATEMEPAQMHPNIVVERLTDRVTEQMTEDERMVKRDVESRLIELRVAQMRRVAELGREMKMEAVAEQEQHRGIKHFTGTERTYEEESESEHMTIDHTKTEVAEMRGKEELKPLAKTRLSELKQAAVESKMKGVKVGVESETQRAEQSKSADFELPTIKRDLESVTRMEHKEELKPAESRRVLEMKHETDFELMELKRLREMKRLAGIERVRRRDCEWDGQMMYVGKA